MTAPESEQGGGSGFPSATVLGVRVHTVTVNELTEAVAKFVSERRRVLVANHNLHSVALLRKDDVLADFYRRSALTFIDSTWLVRFGKWAGAPVVQAHRTTYLDWLDLLFGAATREHWKVAHVGAPADVGERACSALRLAFPGLSIESHHGYFDSTHGSAESDDVVSWVHRQTPDVLLVGMGMPRQERWVEQNFDQFPNCVILTSGACFGYLGGEQKAPPRWSGAIGLEWAFRVAAEPRRLWRRYFVEPVPLVVVLARDLARLRRRHPRG